MLHTFQSADEVLNFAIEREEEAAAFYRTLARTTKRAGMRELFDEFAFEEDRHKAKLLTVKQGQRLASSDRRILDLKIADYTVVDDIGPDIEYADALVMAMKKEKAAFKLYNDLAAQIDDEDLRQLFLGLAHEEAKHKLRFELEYDDFVLTNN